MKKLRVGAGAACIAALAVTGCGKESSSPAAEEKVPPYTYPAPVKGHYNEVNIGEFDVVGGIAYPRRQPPTPRTRSRARAPS